MNPAGARFDGPSAWRPRGVAVIAAGLALGIAIGWTQPRALIWPWLALAGMALLSAAVVVRRARTRNVQDGEAGNARLAAAPGRGRLLRGLIAVASLGFGAAWVTLRQGYVAPDDLASMIDDEPVLARVRGVLERGPDIRDRAAGSLGLFDYRPPVTYFPVRVEALLPREGPALARGGRVLVRVDEPVGTLAAGDRIEALGFLTRPRPPQNPGEFDFRRYAATLGQAGVLVVENQKALKVVSTESPGWRAVLQRWHEGLRRRASGWLLADLPASRGSSTDALLADLLLGQRDPQIDGIEEAFRRVGLSHLLAISGAHLAVLAGAVLVALRWRGGQRRWHGWIVAAAVILYMLLIDVRVPVVRSAVMILVASAGVLAGRRLSAAGLLELSAIAVLLWRPDQLFAPGFQLSFGVVMGLIHLAPIVRTRWFGPRDMLAASTGKMLLEWFKTALALSVTAWAIATPIQVYHFGTISPLGAPLTVLVLPLVSLLLVVGFAKMLLALVLPSAAMLVGAAMAWAAHACVRTVELADALPGASVGVPFGSAPWTLVTLGWVSAAIVYRSKLQRRVLIAAGGVLAAWLFWPALPLNRPALRIDMLSVNNGSCYLIRSGEAAVVFDAGSSPDLDVGRRTIIPALRRLGVRSLDAILISHNDIDHYASVLELADAFAPREILVTPHFIAAVQAEPHGAGSVLLRELGGRSAPIKLVSAGEQCRFGSASFTWLHPSAAAQFASHNDSSAVIRIEAGGRSALLCGDVQKEGMEQLCLNVDVLAADILELPHHGAFSPAAAAFAGRVNPRIALQSTGLRRLRHDRWPGALPGAQRLVTARDGACWVEVSREGEITAGRFVEPSGR